MDEQALLKNIPFSHMLGEPVKACIQAQADGARVTQRFLDEVGLQRNEVGQREAVMVSFQYQNGSQKFQLRLPLITLVPVPYFSVDTLDIEFDAVVDRFDKSLNLECSFANNRTQTSNDQSTLSANRHLKVKLHASQDHMPGGLSTLLHFLDEAINMRYPERPSIKKDLPLNEKDIALFVKKRYTLYPIEPVLADIIQWTSSNPEIVTIDNRGGITAQTPGKAYIFAETYDAIGRCEVIVEDHSLLWRIVEGIRQHISSQSSKPSEHKPKPKPKPQPMKFNHRGEPIAERPSKKGREHIPIAGPKGEGNSKSKYHNDPKSRLNKVPKKGQRRG